METRFGSVLFPLLEASCGGSVGNASAEQRPLDGGTSSDASRTPDARPLDPACPVSPPSPEAACASQDHDASRRCLYDAVDRCPFAFCAMYGEGHVPQYTWTVTYDNCQF